MPLANELTEERKTSALSLGGPKGEAGTYWDTLGRNVVFLEELCAVLGKFQARGIPSLALKGTALLENIYGDIGLRPMDDMDLLIRPEDFSQIDEVLGEIGYTAPHHDWRNYRGSTSGRFLNSISYSKRRGFSVFLHLHWHIVNGVLPAYAYGPLDIGKIWREAHPATIAGIPTRVLAPHHLLIHLSEHLLKHSYNRLTIFEDIRRAIDYYREELNWKALIGDAAVFNLKKPVYFALDFARKFYNASVPPRVLMFLRPPKLNWGERRLQRLIGEGRTFWGLKYFSHLVMHDNFSDSLKFIWHSFFPPRAVLALRYGLPPQKVHFFHYLRLAKTNLVKGVRLLFSLGKHAFLSKNK